MQKNLGIEEAEGFYTSLIDLHQGLSTEQSHQLNARLIMLMAGQIGDLRILGEMLDFVRDNIEESAS